MLMHRLIVVLILLPVLAPELAERNVTGWDKVKRLKPGNVIEVLLNDGRYLRGTFVGASDAALEISIVDGHDPQISFAHDLDRAHAAGIFRIRSAG
jgi:hypothetical protein